MLKSLDTIDRTILLWMHGKHNSLLDQLMPFITNADNWAIPIFLLIVFLGFKAGKKGKISLAILILALAFTDSICAQILKPLFERVRPSHVSMDGLNLLVPKGGKWSMPSNHAANIFALAVVLSYFYDRIKIPLFILASLIALSRVYVGVHYPSDVIVGGLLGYAIGWLAITSWVIIKMRELKRRQTWVWYETDPPVFKN
jgi:undecaprenyl-diphosphatase|tara:strand:- start:82 stop:681 length:600 start_codon:yes stop_codon:yes gene_type:complete